MLVIYVYVYTLKVYTSVYIICIWKSCNIWVTQARGKRQNQEGPRADYFAGAKFTRTMAESI